MNEKLLHDFSVDLRKSGINKTSHSCQIKHIFIHPELVESPRMLTQVST